MSLERPTKPTSDRMTVAIKVLIIVILSAIVLMGVLRVLDQIGTIATIVVGAIFLCYIIYPAVRRLNQRLPLWASVLIVYVVVILLVAVSVTAIVPALVGNIQQLVHDTPDLVRNAQNALTNSGNPFIARLPAGFKDYLDKIPAQFETLLGRYGAEAATSLLAVVLSAATTAALLIVIPMVALYIVVDLDAMRRSLLGLFPLADRPRVEKIVGEIDGVVGGFIRGQLMVAAIVGVLVFILLMILHVKYALLIAIVAGVLEVVPYVGAFVGAVPAIFIALFSNGWENALFVVLGFVVINQLEGNLIAPFIVRGNVGLSPLVVILALLAGGELFGLPGLIVAVPLAGVVKVLLANLLPQHEPIAEAPTLRRSTRARRKQR